ncbi:hypothetical protein IAT38_000435 [Cryptococcus sp. DSM 104549]
MISALPLFSLLVLLGAQAAEARSICYDGYGRRYYCNNGLSWGARLGIGLGVAAGVILLFSICGFWRRRQLKSQFSKYRPPALPFHGQQQNQQYSQNPPPPQAGWNNNPYGSNPAPPPQTYQPSMAGQYTGASQQQGQQGHEHGYEWEQARQAEQEAQANGGAGGAQGPPGYDIATSAQNTGTSNNGSQYQPPPGPPPGKAGHGAV